VGAPVAQDLERATRLAAHRVVVHEIVGHAAEASLGPVTRYLGREDVNDIASILADDRIDFGTEAHTTPVRGDAVFTWDYERTRAGLPQPYQRGKTAQWDGSQPLSTGVRRHQ